MNEFAHHKNLMIIGYYLIISYFCTIENMGQYKLCMIFSSKNSFEKVSFTFQPKGQ